MLTRVLFLGAETKPCEILGKRILSMREIVLRHGDGQVFRFAG